MRFLLIILVIGFNFVLYDVFIWQDNVPVVAVTEANHTARLDSTMPVVDPPVVKVADTVTYTPIHVAEAAANPHSVTDPNTVNILHQVMEYGGSYSERAEYYNFGPMK
jgi:hypothetical protein